MPPDDNVTSQSLFGKVSPDIAKTPCHGLEVLVPNRSRRPPRRLLFAISRSNPNAKSICRCGAAHEKVFNYDCNGMAAQRCPDGTESGVVPLYAVSGLLLPFVWDSRENHQHFKERLLQIETPFSILNQASYFCSAEFLCLIPINR